MESLVLENENQAFEKSNKTLPIDRVILGSMEAQLVAKWAAQLNDQADGLIRFTKADVVNFLIANHGAQFSQEESKAISTAQYDEAKWLGWGLAKVKAAKKSGETLSFDDLIKFRDDLLGAKPPKVRSSKLKKSSKEQETDLEITDLAYKEDASSKVIES